MSKLVLGLDLGITSVGYGLVDSESGNIVKAGVRLFDEGTASENEKRRGFRGSRRLKRRKSFRIQRLQHLLKEEKILTNSYHSGMYNPYECRVKGLYNKLTNEELCSALLHIAKVRGSSLETVEDESNADATSSKGILSENATELKDGKYICEIQLERFNKDGKIRNNKNIFKTKDYEKELRKILSNQNLSEDINNKIIDIITKRRHFSEGPGSYNSPTKYGRYIKDSNGIVNKDPINLIEKMRGTCSIYKDEPRAPRCAYTTDLYNLYNDLNNLTLDDRKITKEEKDEIINNYVNKGKKVSLNVISKVTNVKEEYIKGYRIDGDKPLFTEFKGYNAIRKVVENKENPLNSAIIENKDCVDTICEILTSTKVLEERIEKLLEKIDNNIMDEKAAIKIASISSIKEYASLSFKAMKQFIDEMKDSTENQMQIATRLNIKNEFDKYLQDRKNIPFNKEDILSPVVKRVQNEATKVLNAIRNEYGELESVVIEMAREKNGDEERKNIKNMQDKNKKENEEVKELTGVENPTSKLKLKIRLYNEQHGKCAYSGKTIDLKSLIDDTEDYLYEIDHIIPISISFDDSFNNKVLVTRDANQDKGQRTPFEYFASGKANRTYSEFETWVLGNYKGNKKKIDNLLFKEDITKYDVQQKFVERNLNDTRYACRSLLGTLKAYYKINNINTKVFAIRGSITDQFRKKAKIVKNRDFFEHHAKDALIMATIRNSRSLINVLDKNHHEFDENGVLIEAENYINNNIFDEETMKKINKIKDYNNILFSYKIDTKTNRSISDQTIYSTRKVNDEEYVIKKYKNIYDKNGDGKSLAKLIREGKGNKLLTYKNDYETYLILEKICKEYTSENPFNEYFLEHGKIRKYSKKNNGPEIDNFKYMDTKLGNHVSISHKYNVGDNKNVVLLQISPYRMDLYKDGDNYKFVTIRYSNIKQKGNKQYIDRDWYNTQKKNKKISHNAEFLYSFYRGNIIRYYKDETWYEYKFITVGNDASNTIEVKFIDQKTNNRLLPTISKSIKEIEKYNVTVLGEKHKVSKEILKLNL